MTSPQEFPNPGQEPGKLYTIYVNGRPKTVPAKE